MKRAIGVLLSIFLVACGGGDPEPAEKCTEYLAPPSDKTTEPICKE